VSGWWVASLSSIIQHQGQRSWPSLATLTTLTPWFPAATCCTYTITSTHNSATSHQYTIPSLWYIIQTVKTISTTILQDIELSFFVTANSSKWPVALHRKITCYVWQIPQKHSKLAICPSIWRVSLQLLITVVVHSCCMEPLKPSCTNGRAPHQVSVSVSTADVGLCSQMSNFMAWHYNMNLCQTNSLHPGLQ